MATVSHLQLSQFNKRKNKMTFYTINETHTTDAIAEAIIGREMEVFSYDMNIANYEIMLAALPQDNWPENLLQYQRSPLDQVPDELDQTVSDYQYRDRIRSLLKTERLERGKAYRIYEALLSRIPEAGRTTAIAAAQARLSAQE
jgi:hypothetical protein